MMGISLEMLWTDYMIWGLMLALLVWARLISVHRRCVNNGCRFSNRVWQ